MALTRYNSYYQAYQYLDESDVYSIFSGRTAVKAKAIVDDAMALQEAGAFGIVSTT